MSRPRVAIGLSALLFVLAGLVVWGPALTRERTPVAATGAPAPVSEISPVPLRPGSLLCATDIALSPRTQVAEFIVDPANRPTPALAIRADGPGYRSPVASVPPGPPGRHPIHVQIEPPDRELLGRLCVRNKGRSTVAFYGTRELRTYTRLRTFVDGKPADPDVALTFYENRQVSALGDLAGIVDRMTTSRGFLGAAWFVWVLLALVAVAVPLLVAWALYGALRGVSRDPSR